MDYNKERIRGIELAKKLGATKTAEIIADQKKDFQDIFNTAVDELGLEVVTTQLMKASPVWAHAALSCIPELGKQQHDELTQKALESPSGTITPSTEITTELKNETAPSLDFARRANLMGGEISAISLKNKLAANCQFTAMWYDGGEIQPKHNYNDWNNWLWSGTLTAGCGKKMTLNSIAKKVPNAPLNNGDVVWIYVWVAGGTDMDGRKLLTSYQFTYQSGTPATADFVASGTTTINTLSVNGISGLN
ncbi:hypothetical protein [Psychroserpens damuponensis]|uniref:hypothetical protein n=1 Tax=Psychroserpens damuponensis TaxID=943936 RepID=UPI00058F9528|nr:hypothetical protein [Psychroserpens damuponensis]